MIEQVVALYEEIKGTCKDNRRDQGMKNFGERFNLAFA